MKYSDNVDLTDKLKREIEKKNKKIENSFYRSTLTRLKNENALVEDLRKEEYFGLLVLEIDKFKNFYEIYGFNGANRILFEFSRYLKKNLSSKYEIYHLHLYQFIIRLKGVEKFPLVAKEIEELVEKFSFSIDNDDIDLDVTLGMVSERENATQKALIALTQAKKSKKVYAIYDTLMSQSSISKDILFWKKEIKKAIESKNILPVFQPIVNKEGEIEKFEILMRLKREKDGKIELVSPFFFLDIAIKTKLYPKLTTMMIEKSFHMIDRYPYKFSFNLSFEDIVNPTTMSFLKKNIKKYDIGNKLIIEIVESVDVDNYNIIKDFVVDMRELGIEIAIDDFGSGFSNYLHILEIEPDYLKIDGSLIKNIDNSQITYKFVKSISDLAKSLNIKTIAEFVHSKEVFEVCKSLNIDQYQGYYFSPPLKESELENKINTVPA